MLLAALPFTASQTSFLIPHWERIKKQFYVWDAVSAAFGFTDAVIFNCVSAVL